MYKLCLSICQVLVHAGGQTANVYLHNLVVTRQTCWVLHCFVFPLRKPIAVISTLLDAFS